MSHLRLLSVASLVLCAACGDGASPAASSGKPAASAAPKASAKATATASATASAAAAPSGRAKFDAAYEANFRAGNADEPMPPRIERFVKDVGAPVRTEGNKRFWYASDGTDCFELELADDGTFGASKIFDAKVAAEKCPKP